MTRPASRAELGPSAGFLCPPPVPLDSAVIDEGNERKVTASHEHCSGGPSLGGMRLPLRACLVALLLTLVTAQQHYSAESYTEQLIVTPLADGKVLSNFTFQLSGPWSRTGGQRIASNVEGE